MIKIGRYRLAFGNVVWFQTYVPARVRHFLWFWLLEEVKLTDIDKKPKFSLGTPMQYEGRKYFYMKAGEDIICRDVVSLEPGEDKEEEQ